MGRSCFGLAESTPQVKGVTVGFFSYFRDVVSGTIDKQNKLASNNTAKILEKAQELPEKSFVREWVFHAALSTGALVNYMLFDSAKDKEQPGELDVFHEHRNQLDEKSAYSIFKLLVSDYLLTFLRVVPSIAEALSVTTDDFWLGIGTTPDGFKRRIFNIYEFGESDEARFDHLEMEFGKSHSKYIRTLYLTIVDQSLNISLKPDTMEKLLSYPVFDAILSASYKSFMESLVAS